MAALKERGRHLGRPPWGFKIGEDGVLTIVDERVTVIWRRHCWPPHIGVTRIARELGMNPRKVEAVVRIRPKVLQAWAAAGIDPASHGFSSETVERPKPRPPRASPRYSGPALSSCRRRSHEAAQSTSTLALNTASLPS